MKNSKIDGILLASGFVLKLCALALVITGSVYFYKASKLSKNNEEWKTTTEQALVEQGAKNEETTAAVEQVYETKQAEVKQNNKVGQTTTGIGIAVLGASIVPDMMRSKKEC